jgi:predicted enzyme related to lactoylglutathione lyase
MNEFVHVQLNTGDTKAAKRFYQGLFDWKLHDLPFGPEMTYTMIDTGAVDGGGGIQQKSMLDAPTQWLPYVEVESVRRAIAKARRRGARIVVEHQPIPGMGAFGIFVDPTGATLGVFEGAKQSSRRSTKKKR